MLYNCVSKLTQLHNNEHDMNRIRLQHRIFLAMVSKSKRKKQTNKQTSKQIKKKD